MKIVLFGYGKMGKEVEKIALERGHELILRIENNEEYDISEADVAIDFSVPSAAFNNITSCFKKKYPSNIWNYWMVRRLRKSCNYL